MSEPRLPIVHVVDDDVALRAALVRLLSTAGFEVRSYASAGDFLLNFQDEGCGCLLLDVNLPGGPNGPELQQALARRPDALPVVFLTGFGTIEMGVAAIKSGAVDFLTKPVERDILLATVNVAITRDRERRHTQAQKNLLLARYHSLSPREREVFTQVTAGRLNKQIAYDLGTSERTIKLHRARVMAKFHVQKFIDLIHIANRLNLD